MRLCLDILPETQISISGMDHLRLGHRPRLVRSSSSVQTRLAIQGFPIIADRSEIAGRFEQEGMFRLSRRDARRVDSLFPE